MGQKRKADDANPQEEESHGSTLFVSNLLYSTTQESLQAAFDDLGPVKSCFVVYEKDASDPDGKGQSKGVGYVTFALREDAEAVMKRFDEASSDPIKVDGRVIRAKWADRKPTKAARQGDASADKESKSEVHSKPKKPRSSQPSTPKVYDPNAIRTLVISNLPREGISNTVLWKKVRKFIGAEKVTWPVGDDQSVAHAIFDTPSNAVSAVSRLHAHMYKGSILSVVLKKRADSLFKPHKSSASKDTDGNVGEASATLKPSRAGRLIIRNVPWNTTEDDLRALFTPYGPIHSINIPTIQSTSTPGSASSSSKPRQRGFAFVWFLSPSDAQTAITKCNGATIYGGYAEDLRMVNQKAILGRGIIRKKMRGEGLGSEGVEGEDENQEVDGDGDVSMQDGLVDGKDESESRKREKGSGARKIAVDWALSKDKWEQSGAASAALEAATASGDEDSDGESGNEDESNWVDEGVDNSDDAETVSLDGDEDDDDGEDTSTAGPPQPEEGSTLFVRNVPFEATDDDLKSLFRAFGPLRYARVTMDHDMERSKGTGFVSFWNLADADTCIEEAERMKEDMNIELSSKKNPFSLLTADPSSSRAVRLVLQGRALDVTRAVSREQAEKLREQGEKAREKKDTRNLYLMREGVIFPSSPAASTLTPAELERRQQSFSARKTLLRGNPSLFISKTRLSIRNLPTWVSERGLKRLAVHAIREFEKEVKKGTRTGLSEDEMESSSALRPEDNDDDAKNVKEKGKGKGKDSKSKAGRSTGVKQAKIVRQADRVDALTGKGRSKGYGFLELETHADALRVLRWANNSREANGLMWGWWKDEVKDMEKAGREQITALSTSSPKEGDTSEKGKVKPGPLGKNGIESLQDLEARVKKLQMKLAEMKSRDAEATIKDGRTLHIEFSVENIQVVKRRHEQEVAHQKGGAKHVSLVKSKDKERKGKRGTETDASDTRPAKKARTERPASEKSAKPSSKPSVEDTSKKSGSSIGAIIGKKRKERKLGGKRK